MLDVPDFVLINVICSFECDESENSSVTLKPIGGGEEFFSELEDGMIGGGWFGFSSIIETVWGWLWTTFVENGILIVKKAEH